MNLNAKQAAERGFHFPGMRAWITPGAMPRIAKDAALMSSLVSGAGTGIPAEFTAYVDPMVIDILTRPLKAREIFGEVKKGDFATPYAKFRVNELTGSTEPYSDYGQSRTAGVNYNWLTKPNYVFQTVISYGDLEEAGTAMARINLAADKQRAAAHIIDTDANKFYLYGVDGLAVYGLLNDPSLPPACAAMPSGPGNSTLWEDKSTRQIYDDVLLLFKNLVSQCGGWIDQRTALTLALSPGLAVALGKATDFNVSAKDMLDKYFGSLSIVTLPELSSETTGETMMLIAAEVRGMKTGELGFSEKLRAGRLVPDLSSFSQKWTAGTYGALIYLPFAIAQMRGM